MSRRNVAYSKPNEPNFIKALKTKVGYIEPSTVDTKKEIPQRPSEGDSDDEEVREDEKPTIVVLKEGDVTPEEYGRKITKKSKSAPSGPGKAALEATDDSSGKIEFKKPVKRSSEEGNHATLSASSTKKVKETTQRRETSSRAVKDNNLLSFEEDEGT